MLRANFTWHERTLLSRIFQVVVITISLIIGMAIIFYSIQFIQYKNRFRHQIVLMNEVMSNNGEMLNLLASQQKILKAQQKYIFKISTNYGALLKGKNFSVPVEVTAFNLKSLKESDKLFVKKIGDSFREGTCAISQDLEDTLNLKFGDFILLEGIGVYTFQSRMRTTEKKQVYIFLEQESKVVNFGKRDTRMQVITQLVLGGAL